MKPFYVKTDGITREKQQELLDLSVDAGAVPYDCREPYSAKHQYANDCQSAYTYIGVSDSKTMLANTSEQYNPEALRMTFGHAWEYLQGLINNKGGELGQKHDSDKPRSKPRNKYDREILPNTYVDVYDVLRAFKTNSPALDHAAKKLLASGERGHKDRMTDLQECIQSIQAEIDSMGEWND